MIDPFGARERPQPDHLRRIKAWAAELLTADPDALVVVSEIRCAEPGCPPVETAIMISDANGTHLRKIPCPVADVTRADVAIAAV